MWGVPQFFTTFTANEMGWADLAYACDGEDFDSRPIDATRHYHHRWTNFNNSYLKVGLASPLGKISRKWFRQEDQARGSLHVHMAIWVERAPGIPSAQPTGLAEARNICGTAPQAVDTSDHRAWRQFVQKVQRHDCRKKCHYKKGEYQGEDFCKYLYPRPRCSAAESPRFNVDKDRYEYTCEHDDDERLSPYVPLWLLAWGASMNVQYCTSAGFLSYIAKYVQHIHTPHVCSPIHLLLLHTNSTTYEPFKFTGTSSWLHIAGMSRNQSLTTSYPTRMRYANVKNGLLASVSSNAVWYPARRPCINASDTRCIQASDPPNL